MKINVNDMENCYSKRGITCRDSEMTRALAKIVKLNTIFKRPVYKLFHLKIRISRH